MESNSNAYLDPEEDEIFFYEINEKENELKDIFGNEPTLLNVTKSYDELEKNNDPYERKNSNEETINLLNTAVNLEDTLELNYCGLADLNDLKIMGTVKKEEREETEFSKSDLIRRKSPIFQISTENKNVEQNDEISNSKISISFDNHHTPSKIFFDRNILKTPKSIVKADKDGGFLKILSEIALVKAEADENLYKDIKKLEIQDQKENIYFQEINQDSFGQETKQHLFSDENKENRHFDGKLDIPLIKLIEATPIKSYQSPINAKINCDSNIKKSELYEALNDYDSEFSLNDNLKSFGECTNEQSLENENNSNNISTIMALKEFADGSYQTQVTALKKGNLDSINCIELTFDKDNDISVQDKSIDELIGRGLPEDINSLEINDSYAKLSDKDDKSKKVNLEESFILQQNLNENAFAENKSLDLQINDEKNCPNDNLKSNDIDNCSKNPNVLPFKDEESKRNWLRRNTRRLWEELNEVAYYEKTEKEVDSSRLSGFRLSEEARKVIEAIKAVGIDDSINSSDQFFDLDKINNSFLNNEKSDIFNETLTKPVNSFTKKDFEFLQEKITSNIFDSLKSEVNTESKQALIHNKVVENMKLNQELSKDSPQKIQFDKNTISKSLKNLVTPKQNRLDKQTATQSSSKQIISNLNDINENKPSLLNTQNQARYICQSRLKGCQTSERNVKLGSSTKIPKLSSTSKIPINGRIGKTETGKKTPKLSSLSKVQKSLKFNNIESPVQAYINSRAPVIVSNVKPKSESAFNVWMKHVNGNVKPMKEDKVTNKSPTNKPAVDLPFVEFRSAVPLIVEKPVKSRLPRLAPTMKKLVGSNSPVIAKHKGRLQLNICESGSGADANPTEVSVLYSRVAQVTNVKN